MASDKTEQEIRDEICDVAEDLTAVDGAIQLWLSSTNDSETYMIDGNSVTYTTAKGYASAISMGANALPTYDANNNTQILTVRSAIAVWRYTPLFTNTNTGFDDSDATTAGHFNPSEDGKYFRLIENAGGTAAEIHTRYLPDFTGLGFDGSMSAALAGATVGNNVVISQDAANNLRLSHESPVNSFNRLLTGTTRLSPSAADATINGYLLTVGNDGRNLELVARNTVVTGGGTGGTATFPTGVAGQLLGYNTVGTDTDGDGVPDIVAVSQPVFTEAGFDHTDANTSFPLMATIHGVTNVTLANRVFTLRTEAVAGVMRNVITSIHPNDIINNILGTKKLIIPPATTGSAATTLDANSLLVVNPAQNGLVDVPIGTIGQVLTVDDPVTNLPIWNDLPDFTGLGYRFNMDSGELTTDGVAALAEHDNVIIEMIDGATNFRLSRESFTASFNRILNTALVLPTAADATTNQGMLLTVDNTGKKFNFTDPSMLMAQSQLPTITSQEHKHLAVYNTDPGGTDVLASRWEFVPNWSHLGFNPAGTIREFPQTALIDGISTDLTDMSTAVNLSGLMVGFRAGTSESNLSAYRITDLFNTFLPTNDKFQHAVGAQVASGSLATHNDMLLINSTRTGFTTASRRDIFNHSLNPTNQLREDGDTTTTSDIASAGYMLEVNGSRQRLLQLTKRDVFNASLGSTSKLQRDSTDTQIDVNTVADAGSLMRVSSDRTNLEEITQRNVFNHSLSADSRLRQTTDVTTDTNILAAGSLLQAATNRQTLEGVTKKAILNASLGSASQLRESGDTTTTTNIAPVNAIYQVGSDRQTLTHTTLKDKMNSEVFGTTSANQLVTGNAGMFLVIENEVIGGNQEARIGLAADPTAGTSSVIIRFFGIRKTLNRVELVSGADSFDVDQYDDYFLAPVGTTVNNVSGRIRIDLPA